MAGRPSLLQLDLPARDARAGVASGLGGLAVHRRGARLGVVAPAQVVLIGMDHEAPAHDAVLALQPDELVHDGALGDAALPGLDVAEIAHVPLLVGRSPVRLLEGVVVRASAVAAVAEVGLLVDVEAVLARSEAADLVADAALLGAGLFQRDGAGANAGVIAATAGLALGRDLADCLDGVGHLLFPSDTPALDDLHVGETVVDEQLRSDFCLAAESAGHEDGVALGQVRNLGVLEVREVGAGLEDEGAQGGLVGAWHGGRARVLHVQVQAAGLASKNALALLGLRRLSCPTAAVASSTFPRKPEGAFFDSFMRSAPTATPPAAASKSDFMSVEAMPGGCGGGRTSA
eukprot:CAMPEP_0175218154 /NCGR_PEP_ID=MMETSP0093-20121207/18614_1 /TAXON_ID=311494 /ORGANISM="Alexandrium monilatum, Strain CCMP3105" /LENGTH=345 /DNA_ID=CAMNT_0016511605 /DNA_START=42 /DNA_END=1077 /DNA_ORIENTATION=-